MQDIFPCANSSSPHNPPSTFCAREPWDLDGICDISSALYVCLSYPLTLLTCVARSRFILVTSQFLLVVTDPYSCLLLLTMSPWLSRAPELPHCMLLLQEPSLSLVQPCTSYNLEKQAATHLRHVTIGDYQNILSVSSLVMINPQLAISAWFLS